MSPIRTARSLRLPLGRAVLALSFACATFALAPPASSQSPRRATPPERERGELEEILHGLEMGMVALERLGREEELRALQRVAEDVRRRRAAGSGLRHAPQPEAALREREAARHQIEVMKMARPALLEAERRDTAELLDRMIAARVVRLEGARGEEARRALEREPDLGQQVEILSYAARLWEEFGHLDKATAVGELAAGFRQKWERSREREQHGANDEAAAGVRRRIEILHLAAKALAEGGDEHGSRQLHHAGRALEMRLAGHRGEEARAFLEGTPRAGEQIELLQHAADLYRSFEMPDRADLCAGLAERMAHQARLRHGGERPAGRASAAPRHDESVRHGIERLERRIEEIHAALAEVEEALAALSRGSR